MQGSVSPQTGAITACTPCASPQVSLRSGRTTCSTCRAGWYPVVRGTHGVNNSLITGPNRCKKAPIGRYYNGVGSTPTLCLQGSYTRRANSTACISCPMGRFNTGTGNTRCRKCQAGSAGGGGTASCSLCTPGRYQNATKQVDCKDCPPGRWNTATGGKSCQACPLGTSKAAGVGLCVACDTGKYQAKKAGACLDCPVGRFNAGTGNTGCRECGAGNYTAYNDIASAIQSAWRLQTDPIYPRINCHAGGFSCAELLANISLGKSLSAKNWEREFSCCWSYTPTSPAGNTLPGYSTPPGVCQPCPSGTFSVNGSVPSCALCAPGKFAAGTGNVRCKKCPVGTFSGGAGAAACAACTAPSQYQDQPGRSYCSTCNSRTQSQTKGVTKPCALCPAGTIMSGGICVDCLAGQYSAKSGSLTCSACQTGRYSAQGYVCSMQRVLCFASPHALTQSLLLLCVLRRASRCTSCSIGRFTSDPTVPCADCTAGKYASKTDSPICQSCPPGKVSGSGAAHCGMCAVCLPLPLSHPRLRTHPLTCILVVSRVLQAGKFDAANGGGTDCTPCPEATYAAASGSTRCAVCPPGSQALNPGSAHCDTCAIGWFVNGTQFALNPTVPLNCTKCPLGYSQFATNQTFCFQCTYGKNAPILGSKYCLDCPAGTRYLDTTLPCEPCPAGYAQRDAAADYCYGCQNGQYSPFPGSRNCTDCERTY